MRFVGKLGVNTETLDIGKIRDLIVDDELNREKVSVENGSINVTVAGNSGNIWVAAGDMPEYKPVDMAAKKPETASENSSANTDRKSVV